MAIRTNASQFDKSVKYENIQTNQGPQIDARSQLVMQKVFDAMPHFTAEMDEAETNQILQASKRKIDEVLAQLTPEDAPAYFRALRIIQEMSGKAVIPVNK